MWYLFIALIALGVVAALIETFSKKTSEQIIRKENSNCSTCEGSVQKCEHDCMLEAAIKEIEYFDDEELDQFKGRDSAEYSQKEVEMFQEILYTMKPQEVREWIRSLTLREINIPNEIKDEVMVMIE